jgi:hypothetical protein
VRYSGPRLMRGLEMREREGVGWVGGVERVCVCMRERVLRI